jgi:hypothetical protein
MKAVILIVSIVSMPSTKVKAYYILSRHIQLIIRGSYYKNPRLPELYCLAG